MKQWLKPEIGGVPGWHGGHELPPSRVRSGLIGADRKLGTRGDLAQSEITLIPRSKICLEELFNDLR
jgi:hypothetical protein